MAKFDFNNSRYAALFNSREGINFLQSFIDNSEMLRINYGWWRTQYSIADTKTPKNAKGDATFTVSTKKSTSAPLMDMRAPYGDSIPLDKEGFAFYSASIPDFITPGLVETAMERQYKEEYFAQFGNDAKILQAWAEEAQLLIDSKDQTLNYLGAQLQSTGKTICDFGRGIRGRIQKAEIPAENFVKAGEKTWTDPTCKLLTQMVEIEYNFRERTNYQGAMKWMVTYDMFQKVILQNAEVREWIQYYRDLNTNSPTASPEIKIIPEELFRNATASIPGLSPIEIVVEKEKNLKWDKATMVNGWEEGIAVLRPVGYAGDIQYTDILDENLFPKFGVDEIKMVFASLDGGIARLVNSTVPNGRLKEWHTDLMMSAIPSLTEFPWHIIVDTTKTN